MDSVIIFIIVLGILIFFHELGHFLVARVFGVGVEKFSLGFGPRILGKKIGRTDYRISIVPLGGYVKMVGDEPDSPIADEDLPFSFTHKHVAKRAAIVAAGPIFNVLLAILIFTSGLFFAGLPSVRPVVRSVDSDSPAQAAGIQTGDFIKAIGGRSVESWRDIDLLVDESQGHRTQFTLERLGERFTADLVPVQMHAKNLFGDDVIYYDAGIKGYNEPKAVVDETVPGMPAEVAGLLAGDQIAAIDGHPIEKWETMQEMVSTSEGKTLTFTIVRDGETLEVPITPVEVQNKDMLGAKQSVFQIGIRRTGISIPEEDQITVRLGPLDALGQGLSQTWNMIYATGYFFVKLAQRQVPADTIGGPIRIAQMAHKEAQEGLLNLFYFIAIISVNLAVLNLLPIPVLDGGHLLFYLIEAIQGKPVSVRVREAAQQVGIILLVMLMIFVFYNDISSLWFK